jgi:hypothetical protein
LEIVGANKSSRHADPKNIARQIYPFRIHFLWFLSRSITAKKSLIESSYKNKSTPMKKAVKR